jgi:hypothetical protein
MRSPIAIVSLAVVAAVFTIKAGAETGRPSCIQTQRSDEAPASKQTESSGVQPGSYARYLMLNGVTREAAIQAAWTVDHPPTASKSSGVSPAASATSTVSVQR